MRPRLCACRPPANQSLRFAQCGMLRIDGGEDKRHGTKEANERPNCSCMEQRLDISRFESRGAGNVPTCIINNKEGGGEENCENSGGRARTRARHGARALAIGNRAQYPRICGFAHSRAPPTCTHVARGLVLFCSEGSTKSFVNKRVKKFKTKQTNKNGGFTPPNLPPGVK